MAIADVDVISNTQVGNSLYVATVTPPVAVALLVSVRSDDDAEMVDEEGIDVTAVMGKKGKKRKADGEPGEDGEAAGTPAPPKPKKEPVRFKRLACMKCMRMLHAFKSCALLAGCVQNRSAIGCRPPQDVGNCLPVIVCRFFSTLSRYNLSLRSSHCACSCGVCVA